MWVIGLAFFARISNYQAKFAKPKKAPIILPNHFIRINIFHAAEEQSINHFKREDHLYKNETLSIWTNELSARSSNCVSNVSVIQMLISITDKRIPDWNSRIEANRIAKQINHSMMIIIFGAINYRVKFHVGKFISKWYLQLNSHPKGELFSAFQKKQSETNNMKEKNTTVSFHKCSLSEKKRCKVDSLKNGQEYTRKSETIKIHLEVISDVEWIVVCINCLRMAWEMLILSNKANGKTAHVGGACRANEMAILSRSTRKGGDY